MVALIVVCFSQWSLADEVFRPGSYITVDTQNVMHYFPKDKDLG